MNLTNGQKESIFSMYWGCQLITPDGERKMIGICFGKIYVETKPKNIYPSKAYFTYYLDDVKIILKTSKKTGVPLLHEQSQYLIKKYYAVPLFIESGHPDNGKTAIELGLAIDSTNNLKELNKT